MRRMATLLVAGSMGCSSGGDDGPLECSASDRTGTYLIHYVERSGDCGAIPDVIGRLDAAEAVEPGCTVTAERWSQDECKLERSLHCVSEPDNLQIDGTAVSEQTDSSGERLEGLYTIEARDLSGAYVCLSTYDITATRQ